MTRITAADLQPWQDPEHLLDCLTRLMPNQLGEFRDELRSLLRHDDEDVREQAVRGLFVHLMDANEHDQALHILRSDPSPNVRRAAAFGLCSISSPATRDRDAEELLRAFFAQGEPQRVKEAAYEALLLLFDRTDFPPGNRALSLANDVDWNWIESLRAQYRSK